MSAIDPRLLGHYNRELSYLRRRAGEFAEDHRQVAGLLGLDAPTDPDPHVERLMEGVAYLNARVRLKMDEQFPVFTQYLLDSLYPHYLATTPAMGIMAITPTDDPGIKAGALHPRGSAIVASLTGDATLPVQFRTGFDVTLWPIKLGGIEYLPTRAAVAAATDGAPGDAALRLRIDATSAAAIAEMGIDTLSLFFDGGGDTPNLVHQQVLSECVGVRVVAPERGRRSAWIEPAGPVEAMGFGEDEALLPNEARSFRGYRLLAEYFALPEKFRFARLTGLKAGMARAEKAVDIVILFRRSIPALGSAVSNDTVVLFATPVINLFEKRFDRAIVDKRTHEHIILPDRAAALDYEVYRLDEVTAFAKGDAAGIPALPLYARRAQRGVRPLFYSLRRKLRRLSEAETRKRRENDYIGAETWISLSSPGEPALASGITELGMRGLVSNRALATRLRPGAGALDLSLTDTKGVARIAILRGPTRPQPPMGMVDGGWRIVSHLAPGHDGFVRDDGAPDLLADHLSLYVRDEAPALRREIQGIVGLTATNVTRRVAGDMRVAFQRGQKLTLQVAMGSYEASSAYLFTSVVARFLAEFATINSFAECEVRADNGLTWGWGGMAGTPTDHLTTLLAEVEADPTRWGAFAFWRGVDASTPNGPRIGEALDPSREVIDLAHQPSQDFPRTTIAAFVKGKRRPTARSQHLGLTGPMGALPIHLTELAIFERRKKGDTPFADFLDLISARALQRFYRAWAEADRCAQADRPADDRFAGYIGATSGAADLSFVDAASRPKPDKSGDAFDGWRRLPYAGHLAGLRSAAAVGDLLSHLLERPVRVVEAVGRWRAIPADARTRIGRAHAGLGQGATLGGRFYAVEFDVAFEIGVTSMAGLEDLLPGGHANRLLGEAARTALPKHLDWRARVTIPEPAIAPARLGKTRLGWTSWIAPRGTARTRRDLALRDNAATRAA